MTVVASHQIVTVLAHQIVAVLANKEYEALVQNRDGLWNIGRGDCGSNCGGHFFLYNAAIASWSANTCASDRVIS